MSYPLQNKPLQLFYYIPFMPSLTIPTIPLINPYQINNFPQPINQMYYTPIPGTSQDNCIVIEDDQNNIQIQNPLNQNQSYLIQPTTNRDSFVPQELMMQQEQSCHQLVVQNDKLNEHKPHIRISVFKQHQNQADSEFILQNDRILGTTYGKEIIIGRKKQQEDKFENCEIQLPHGDKNVENQHCKILTEKGFAFSNNLTKPILLYFYIVRKINEKSRLPFTVIKHIYSFIKEKPQFYIVDNGTRSGTFMKVKKDKYKKVELDNTYLIGADTYFHIVELNSEPKFSKSKKSKDFNYFIRTLVKEHNRKTKIHGLTLEETEQFNAALNEDRTTKTKQRGSHKLSQYDRPYLKIAFNHSPLHQAQTHIFIANSNQESSYKIGRSQECDVIININTVSRKQAQILYKNNEWLIQDGEGIRESANGTWQSLQNYFQRSNDKKMQSKPRLIEDQMEIKISENIVKFDFINFGVTKKRKLDKALIEDLLSLQ